MVKGGWELHGIDDEPFLRIGLFLLSISTLVGVLIGGFIL
tara:strand:- start:264 stop:383 length:120 start_codon:yes stop_codon:yes gene_type:complete